MIKVKHHGNFAKTEKFLEKGRRIGDKLLPILSRYGAAGVSELSAATPKDTGETANSWSFSIEVTSRGYTVVWTNNHENQGYSVALLVQYGHGLQNGSYVEGRDFINPAIRPIFDNISSAIAKEVASL